LESMENNEPRARKIDKNTKTRASQPRKTDKREEESCCE
jgi:hypothetical protein